MKRHVGAEEAHRHLLEEPKIVRRMLDDKRSMRGGRSSSSSLRGHPRFPQRHAQWRTPRRTNDMRSHRNSGVRSKRS